MQEAFASLTPAEVVRAAKRHSHAHQNKVGNSTRRLFVSSAIWYEFNCDCVVKNAIRAYRRYRGAEGCSHVDDLPYSLRRMALEQLCAEE
ncbi:MAG: hypothetical protein AAFO91_08815 [Bacteroidota bacterium]